MTHICKSKARQKYGDRAPKTHYEYNTKDVVKHGSTFAPKRRCGYCGERL